MRTCEAETAVRQRPRSIPSLLATQRGSEYARLSRQIKQAGLRERRPGSPSGRSRPPPCCWPPDGLPSSWRATRGGSRRWPCYLFFPPLLLEAISLHVASISALTSRPARRWSWEAVLLGIHVPGYLAVVFLVLSPVKAVVFILVQQGLFGLYLGCSFAPNHKGMPILGATDQSDFLRRQVLTSRNVRGGWLTAT